MKQFTRSSSYSWWRDSRNSPNQSAWLRNALEEIDEKTQNMLSLIEAEADSFAQRAEIFYHNRPQLISMIEEYYRAYRSLAEQFDHLKGEIRQNVPKPLQVKYGLSCEAPLESPFRKQFSGNKNPNQRFKELLRRQERYGSDSEVSEVDDPEPEDCNRRSKRHSDQESIRMIPSDLESESTLSYSDSEVASHVVEPAETENVGSIISEMQVKMQEENLLLVKQLTAKNIQVKHLKIENNKLKKEKAFCKEEMSLVVQDRSLLQKELEIIKLENTKLRNENEVNVWERNDLHKELDFIRYENKKLRNENEINVQQLKVLTKKVSNLQKENKSYKSMSLVLGCVNGQAARLARSNVRLRNEMCGGNKQSEGTVQFLKDEKKKVEVILEDKENLLLEQSFKIKELQSEVCDRKLELDVIKAENTQLSNENEDNGQKMRVLTEKISNLQKEKIRFSKQNKIMSTVLGFHNGHAESLARSNLRLRKTMCRGNRHGKDEANVQMQVLSEKVRSLEEENTNLSKQNKIMAAVLIFVNSQAARVDTSDARTHNEIHEGNCQSIATLQILKDEKKKAEITVEAKEKFISEQNLRIEELQREVCGLAAENTKLRDEIKVNVHQLQVLKENVCNLQEENIKLCAESKNVEITLEAKEKLVMEQSLRIGALQNEVSLLLDENRVQEIQLVERDEQKREAIRQLCFTLDALMDKNKRLQEALQKLREEVGRKPNNIRISTSQIPRWKKFLFTMLDGRSRPMPLAI